MATAPAGAVVADVVEDRRAYSSAQARGRSILEQIAKGVVWRVNGPAGGVLAYNDWVQHNAAHFFLARTSTLLDGASRALIEFLYTDVYESAVDALTVADALGPNPHAFPLFVYGPEHTARAGKHMATLCCSSSSATDEPLVVRVPLRVPRRSSSTALAQLVRRVRYMNDTGAKFLDMDVNSTRAAMQSRGSRPISLVVGMKSAETYRAALQVILRRTGVLPAIGRPVVAPQFGARCPVPDTVAKPSRKDVMLLFYRPLFRNVVDEPGSAFRDGNVGKAVRRALNLVLRPPVPTGDAHTVGADAIARSADLDTWIAATLAALEIDPHARIALPANTRATGIERPLDRRPFNPVPATELASAFRRHVLQGQGERLLAIPHPAGDRDEDNTREAAAGAGVEPGGVTAAGPPQQGRADGGGGLSAARQRMPRLDSVRGAHERELIAAARAKAPMPLGAVPSNDVLSPAHVFGENGLAGARAHVLHHTGAVPRQLHVPLYAAVATAGCSADFDGVAVNLRSCPWPVSQGVFAARPEDIAAAAGAAPTSLTNALTDLVQTSVRQLTGSYHGMASAAATLRAQRRPAHLILARALHAPRLDHHARAAVEYVFGLASARGICGALCEQLVSVRASGAVTVTKLKPTVDAAFISGHKGDTFLLPTTSGTTVEPLQVVVVGVSHEQADVAVQDVVAAIVARERITGGSTGVAREDGLRERGPNDCIVVGGGALVPLSILVLLLVRHAARRRKDAPFAFIKS